MDRLLSCECGREHVVSRSQAGQELKCDCGKIVAVPTLRGLAELPLAPANTSDAPLTATSGASRSTSSGAWQGWRGPAMAIATAGFLIAFTACGWYSWQRFNINTSYTVENEIVAGNELLDSYDANSLSSIWHEFGSLGLGEKYPPSFFLWQLYADDRQQRAMFSGGIAAAFGVLALAIAFSVKRK